MKTVKHLTIAACLLLAACAGGHKQPAELEKGKWFDLEQLSFDEDAPRLFSRVLAVDGMRYNQAIDGPLAPEALDFVTWESAACGVRIPAQKYGYLFESCGVDSMACFCGAWFDHLKMLTRADSTVVGVYAQGEYITRLTELEALNAAITEKYGRPYRRYELSERGVITSEWRTADRLIQLHPSRGVSFTAVSGREPERREYYLAELTIIKLSELDALVRACTMRIEAEQIPGYTCHEEEVVRMGDFKIYSADRSYDYEQIPDDDVTAEGWDATMPAVD